VLYFVFEALVVVVQFDTEEESDHMMGEDSQR
jgi:hypothetical protein